MRLLRRAVILLALALSLLFAASAAADTKLVSRITILLDRTEIGLNANLPLFADAQPRSAGNRTVAWQVMSGADALIDAAKSRLGCPYVWGATGPDAFDCSGFVRWCIQQTGVPFQHVNSFGWRTTDQFTRIEDIHDILPGDVLVFTGDTEEVSGHVGIYLGGNSMIDASSSQERVRITDDVYPDRGYWHAKFVAAYRIFTENGAATISNGNILRASAPGTIGIKAYALDGGGAAAYRFITVLPLDGMGTLAQPYCIDAPQSLAWARTYPDACYRLTNNIDLSTLADGFAPIGTSDAPFTGLFDGDGYAIGGLTQQIEGDTTAPAGLFGTVDGGIIQNLAVDNAHIRVTAADGKGVAGVLAGLVTGEAQILLCSTSGQVVADTAGGIAGIMDGSAKLQNCYSLSSVRGSTAGGIAGAVAGKRVSLTACYSIGGVAGETAGGIAGSSDGKIKNCYYLNRTRAGVADGNDTATKLNAEAFMLRQALESFPFDTVWTYRTEGGYPYPVLLALRPRELLFLDDPRFAAGSGLPFDPYCILTEAHLRAASEDPGAYYRLTGDITLSEALPPIGSEGEPFTGAFDGGGYTLSHLAVSADGFAGLFGVADGAHIYDLTLFDISIQGDVAGGLAGLLLDAEVSSCTVSGQIAGGSAAGGIAGVQTGGRLMLCRTDATVAAMQDTGVAGGLIGSADGDTAIGYAAGTITGHTAGGLIGDLSGTLQNAFFSGTATGETAGGLTGILQRDARITGCYTVGTAAGAQAGPIAGDGGGSVSRCYYLAMDNELPGKLGTPLTAEAMRRPDAYSKYDFTSVWTVDGSGAYPYPELRQLPYLPGRITQIQIDGPIEVFPGMPTAYTASAMPDTVQGNALAFTIENGTGSAIVDENGVMTGITAGTVTLICRATDGGDAEASLLVTVLPVHISTLAIEGPVLLHAGEAAAYAAVSAPDAVNPAYVCWESSDPAVLSVSADGKATALRPGTATLTVRVGTLVQTLPVTVSARAMTLTLNADTCRLAVGYSFALQPSFAPADATDTLFYASSDRRVATVDRNGLITAAGVGEAIITVTGESGVSCLCRVTVVPYVLEADQILLTLRVGERAALPITLTTGVGFDAPGLLYSSISKSIHVDRDGTVNAKQAGIGMITISAQGDPGSALCIAVAVIP